MKMDNHDSFQIKLEQDLIIKSEPEEVVDACSFPYFFNPQTRWIRDFIGDVIDSKKDNSLDSKLQIKVEERNDHITQEFATSDFNQAPFKLEREEFIIKDEPEDDSSLEITKVVSLSRNENEENKYNPCGKKRGKPLECPKCQRCFTRTSACKQHALIHEGKKPFRCQQCGKNFTQSGSLKTHMVIHEDTKPFRCQQCDQGFNQSGHLKQHMLLHESKRPFQCQLCRQSFTQSGNLKQHMLLHEGQKRFMCQHCGRSFTRNSHLKEHILVHEGKRPFGCQQCGRSFSQARNLKRHMLLHEAKKLSEAIHGTNGTIGATVDDMAVVADRETTTQLEYMQKDNQKCQCR